MITNHSNCTEKENFLNSEQEIFHEGNFVEDIVFEGEKTSATYVRITAKHAGLIPEDHFMRPGQISKFCFDEIIIK